MNTGIIEMFEKQIKVIIHRLYDWPCFALYENTHLW
jgi:hypothetical protein